MTDTADTIVFGGEEYAVDSLSEKGKYIVVQIKDLQDQSRKLKAKLDQVEVAINGFSGFLQEELNSQQEQEQEQEQEESTSEE